MPSTGSVYKFPGALPTRNQNKALKKRPSSDGILHRAYDNETDTHYVMTGKYAREAKQLDQDFISYHKAHDDGNLDDRTLTSWTDTIQAKWNRLFSKGKQPPS